MTTLNDDTRRLLLDRVVALRDHLEDIEALLPPTPHSCSIFQLNMKTFVGETRKKVDRLIEQIRDENAARRRNISQELRLIHAVSDRVIDLLPTTEKHMTEDERATSAALAHLKTHLPESLS